MPDVSSRAVSEDHFSMGQSRKSQDAVEAIRLQDRVIEKSIRPPPVGRFGAIHYGLLRHLLAQVTPDPNRPLTGERVRKDLPGNMCLRHFVLAPKASFETSGEWSSLPFVRKRRYAPHPPPKGHACLIGMRQHAAFGPPPWWGGSISEKSSSEAKDPTGCLSSQIARFGF